MGHSEMSTAEILILLLSGLTSYILLHVKIGYVAQFAIF